MKRYQIKKHSNFNNISVDMLTILVSFLAAVLAFILEKKGIYLFAFISILVTILFAKVDYIKEMFRSRITLLIISLLLFIALLLLDLYLIINHKTDLKFVLSYTDSDEGVYKAKVLWDSDNLSSNLSNQLGECEIKSLKIPKTDLVTYQYFVVDSASQDTLGFGLFPLKLTEVLQSKICIQLKVKRPNFKIVSKEKTKQSKPQPSKKYIKFIFEITVANLSSNEDLRYKFINKVDGSLITDGTKYISGTFCDFIVSVPVNKIRDNVFYFNLQFRDKSITHNYLLNEIIERDRIRIVKVI